MINVQKFLFPCVYVCFRVYMEALPASKTLITLPVNPAQHRKRHESSEYKCVTNNTNKQMMSCCYRKPYSKEKHQKN